MTREHLGPRVKELSGNYDELCKPIGAIDCLRGSNIATVGEDRTSWDILMQTHIRVTKHVVLTAAVGENAPAVGSILEVVKKCPADLVDRCANCIIGLTATELNGVDPKLVQEDLVNVTRPVVVTRSNLTKRPIIVSRNVG
ncbi:hypothetical protein IPO96_01000 [Candidatus Saccharibacteria bacterium]|nr:MAG: hypothetical protein IPO96_01000 [Candidatus Saccharibacteria bacterium]